MLFGVRAVDRDGYRSPVAFPVPSAYDVDHAHHGPFRHHAAGLDVHHQLWEVWNEEAEAALGAKEAGAVVHLWKVAGERTVFALCDFPMATRSTARCPACRSASPSAPARDDDVGRLPLRAVRGFLREIVEGG